jgi:hypothetical protein
MVCCLFMHGVTPEPTYIILTWFVAYSYIITLVAVILDWRSKTFCEIYLPWFAMQVNQW